MTFAPQRDPVPELTTTRTGGRSAKLIALAVVVVLGSVIYIGISGQSGSPESSASPTSLPVAAATTRATAHPLTEVESVRADPTAPVLYQYLGTGLSLNGHETLAILDPVAPNQYRGIYRIPYSLVTPTADLEFAAVTASVSHDELDRLGVWTFPLNSVHPGAGPSTVVLDVSEPSRVQPVTDPTFSRLATNGYHITVTTSNEVDGGLMTIDIAVNPDQFVPDESYSIAAGPSGGRFNVQLGQSGATFLGQGRVPDQLLGRLIPVSLLAVPISDPSLGPITVSTWWIQVATQPKDNGDLAHVEEHNDGRPIASGEAQVLASGYDISIEQVVVRGHLDLRVIFTVRTTSGPPQS
jgi:hypothetical protein